MADKPDDETAVKNKIAELKAFREVAACTRSSPTLCRS